MTFQRAVFVVTFLTVLLGGCGGVATHARQVTEFPDGRRVTEDYWIAGCHVLSDPEIAEASRSATGGWKLVGFRSKTDDKGIEAVTGGLVDVISKLWAP